jgi:hypothetical protein
LLLTRIACHLAIILNTTTLSLRCERCSLHCSTFCIYKQHVSRMLCRLLLVASCFGRTLPHVSSIKTCTRTAISENPAATC